MQNKYELIDAIISRADKLGFMKDKVTHLIDISKATDVFDIDLQAWLDADDNNFVHDFVGVYRNIDRETINRTHKATKDDFNFFVPRFAR